MLNINVCLSVIDVNLPVVFDCNCTCYAKSRWTTSRMNTNYSVFHTRDRYHRRNHTTPEHKQWLAIAHYIIGVCTW